MENKEIYNKNKVTLRGIVEDEPQFDHEVKGEKFYYFTLNIERFSKTCDILPVIISEKLIAMPIKKGMNLAVTGQFRSHNKVINDKNTLQLTVFVKGFEDEALILDNTNEITLSGTICKPPQFRKTPFEREICDIFLAVNRTYNKSDYIPCIAWGRNAKFAAGLKVGDQLSVTGRIQSRNFAKHVSEEETIIRTAYEVSIRNLILEVDYD